MRRGKKKLRNMIATMANLTTGTTRGEQQIRHDTSDRKSRIYLEIIVVPPTQQIVCNSLSPMLQESREIILAL